jgi:type IV secretion system protein VirB3
MLRQSRIHTALHRSPLWMGGDRELVMSAAGLAILLGYTLQLVPTLIGIALWFVSLRLLRNMAKADPRMRGVYDRHRRYRAYYPARSTPFRNN